MKIIIEVESVEEARQIFRSSSSEQSAPQETLLARKLQDVLALNSELVSERDQLEQEVADYKSAFMAYGISPFNQSKMLETMKFNTAVAKERDRYKAALEDIAHGPVGAWNDPIMQPAVIKSFMRTAEQALHPEQEPIGGQE